MAMVRRKINIKYFLRNIFIFKYIGGIMNKLLLTMYSIYSYSPVLLVSDDDNFGTLEGKIKKDKRVKENIRFSLCSLSFGNTKLYFITGSKKDKFKVLHTINLNKYFKDVNTDTNIEKKSSKYRFEHLTTLNESDRSLEKEFIEYKMDSELRRKDIANNKINLYLTIILAIIPLILILFSLDKIKILQLYNIAGIIFLLYFLMNITLLILQATKVSGMSMSRFLDLKEEKQNKRTKLISQYYYDWQQIKLLTNLLVSYVKNIERWIKITILCH